jgi:hypothetical protein
MAESHMVVHNPHMSGPSRHSKTNPTVSPSKRSSFSETLSVSLSTTTTAVSDLSSETRVTVADPPFWVMASTRPSKGIF